MTEAPAKASAESSDKQKELKDLFSQLSEYTKKNDIVLVPLIKTLESNPEDELKQKELDAIVSELCQFSISCGDMFRSILDTWINPKTSLVEKMELLKDFGKACSVEKIPEDKIQKYVKWILSHYSILNTCMKGNSEKKSKFTQDEMISTNTKPVSNFILVGNTMFPINQIARISFYDGKIPQVIVKLYSETEPIMIYFNPFDQEVSYTEQKQKIIDKLSNLVK